VVCDAATHHTPADDHYLGATRQSVFHSSHSGTPRQSDLKVTRVE
jgi:hypothetical protein